MLQDMFHSSSLYENSGSSVEIQQQVRIFSERIAHSPAAQQGFVSAGRGRLQLDSTHRRSSLSAVVPARLTSASPKADFGASCERFCEDSQASAFDSESTENHRGPTGPVHRQNRRCFCVLQHQVRSI